MNGVGVIRVMDDAGLTQRVSTDGSDMREAHDAVAELIAANDAEDAAMRFHIAHPTEHSREVYCLAMQRRRNAAARVKGHKA